MVGRARHVVSSFSYPINQDPIIREAAKIAEREDKSLSQVIMELISDYVKKHGKGNPIYPLTTFMDNPKALALPTIYEDPTNDKVHALSADDKKFIKEQMAKWYRAIQH